MIIKERIIEAAAAVAEAKQQLAARELELDQLLEQAIARAKAPRGGVEVKTETKSAKPKLVVGGEVAKRKQESAGQSSVRVLEVLGDGSKSVAELCSATGFSNGKMYYLLDKLDDAGKIERDKNDSSKWRRAA